MSKRKNNQVRKKENQVKKLDEIEEIQIDENTIKKNEKSNKIKLIFLFYIPITIVVILAMIYFFLRNIFVLISMGVAFFVLLFGIDGKMNTCPECRKWGQVIWNEKKSFLRTRTKRNYTRFNRIKEIKKKDIIVKSKGKCTNCGKIIEKEKVRRKIF